MSRYYPIFLNIEGRKCVVIGGGNVASRKVPPLLDCGAKVLVVSPEISSEMERFVKSGEVEYIAGKFEPSHLSGAALVIGSTDDAKVNRMVYEECKARNIPVNVVDQPELCTFIVPSLVKRGDLMIATSTSGKSPAVAKRVRKTLEKDFGEEWGAYLDMMGRARIRLMEKVSEQPEREAILNRLADSPMFELIKSGDMDGAEKIYGEIVP